ncbi:MAG: hypothetical protein SGI92_24825 [Bryobacteraceae bacterium]|nr:hypothetical protein [Bryobacteraceae bacterium]
MARIFTPSPAGSSALRLCLSVFLFTVLVSAQAPISITPGDLTFSIPANSSTPSTATLTIAQQNGAPYSATIRYLSNPSGWLNMGPATGIAPATLTVTANASGLSPGTYLAQITVTINGLGRAVNVTLVVGGAPGSAGTLLVNPTALTFIGGTAGEQSAPPREITVTAPPGSSQITFRAVSSTGWISVPPLPFTTPTTVPVVAYQTGLAAGTYTGTVQLIPSNGGPPTVVPVTLKAAGAASTTFNLTLNQSSVLINYQSGTATPGPASVSISTNIPDSSIREFSAKTTTAWIKMTSLLNNDPVKEITDFTGIDDVKIYVDPTGLTTGSYTGNITFSSVGLPDLNLPVTLRVSAVQELNAQPSSLIMSDASLPGGINTLAQQIQITSTGSGPLTFTLSAASVNDWLKVTASAFTTAGGAVTLQVTAVPTGLPKGTYNGTINLTANNGSVLQIPALLNVSTAPNQSNLFVVPELITLSGTRGRDNPSQILQIGTEIGSIHPYTVSTSSSEGWLAIDTVSGSAPGRVTVSANLSRLSRPGSYAGSVLITSLLTSQTLTVPVTLQVDDDALRLSPDALTFTQAGRFGPFPPQTLRITSSTPNARFVFLDVPSWLRVSDLSGTAPMSVSIWPDVALVPPGTTGVRIRVQGPNNTVTLPISVSFAEPPGLTVVPEAVALTYALGGVTIPSQVLAIDTGGEPNAFSVTFTTESGRKWLKVDPLSGATPGTINVTIDPSLVTTGTHRGSILVRLENGSGQVRAIPVTLAVNPPAAVIEAVLHGATQAPAAVAPGQSITITGYGFGPVTGISARATAAGAYETRLADTRVLFDGVPAPMLFLRSDQINAVAPYSLTGRISTRLQVEQGGNLWSLPVDLRVVESQPGLFTVGGSGRGQASAVNQDFNPNSSLNPAERGSLITIFGTGEGQTDPPGQDGRVITSDLRRPILPVTALIGGRPAEVLYIGSASGLVSGVFQANLRVPTDIQPGILPVQIQVGTAVSNASVTIVVK